ncbi:MAG: metallophosphoesterase [Clostridia bacterium]|nr:metallophosphoesterase [Clostridia bacterium]
MRFLFFTDTHIRGTKPRNRKDDFYETLKKKFLEIKQICHDMNVDYVLHGGDWFDRPDVSPAVVKDFARLVKDFSRPVFTVAGNHDIYGQNPETISRTMLGLMEGVGIINLIDYNDAVVVEKEGIRVQITGKSYRYDIDGDSYRDYYIVKKGINVDFAINIVHGMLLAKPFFEGIRHTLIDDISETEADLTLAGHYHSGFETRVINGKYFINPGSLVRISNTMSEISRRPKVILADMKNSIEIHEIELLSALPGEEVLDRLQLEKAQDRLVRLQQFYSGLSSTGDYSKVDIQKIIDEIASNENLDDEIRNEAIRRISMAKDSLGDYDE